jgi:hypothetical protein
MNPLPQPNHHLVASATGAGGGVWWFVDQLVEHGLSWRLVPPFLLGIASAISAVRSYQDGRQARRHREDLHRLRLEKMRAGELPLPSLELLEDRL